jgi:hypothetical protein
MAVATLANPRALVSREVRPATTINFYAIYYKLVICTIRSWVNIQGRIFINIFKIPLNPPLAKGGRRNRLPGHQASARQRARE